MKQNLKDLDNVLKALDAVKNSTTNKYKKVNEVITRRNLTDEYYLDLENTLIADSYVAIEKSKYVAGSINNLTITYNGSKFINKGGYVTEYKKDNAFKTDLLFKVITTLLAVVTISLTVWIKILENKCQEKTNIEQNLNQKIITLEDEFRLLKLEIFQLQKSAELTIKQKKESNLPAK